MKKVALVTGASAGIGEATVKRLLAEGYDVYAAARRVDRMAGLAELGAHPVNLDLTDDGSIVAAMERIRAEAGRLDVLVNNAGYGSYGALEDVPMEEARRQFEVNLFGAARLTQLALPMMRAQRGGKIVNVSSIGGRFGEPFGAWYHATKYALEGLSDSIRPELKPFGIDVIIIEPGAIRTEWGPIAHDSMLAMSGSGPYAREARIHAKIHEMAGTSTLPSSPDVVADKIARSIRAKRPRARYPVGGGAHLLLFLNRVLGEKMMYGLALRMAKA